MRDCHRLELFFPLLARDAHAQTMPWPETGLGLEDWDAALYPGFARVAGQMPRLCGLLRGGRVSVSPALASDAAALGAGTVALMVTPQGDAVICLGVDVRGDFDELIRTLQAVRDEAAGHTVLYEGLEPLEALRAVTPPPIRDRLAYCTQAGPVAAQHVSVVNVTQIALFVTSPKMSVTRDAAADPVDLGVVGRLVYYDALPYASTPIRPAQSGVTFPTTANRYEGTVAAVSPNGSVIAGHAEGLTAGMVLAHVIVLGAKQRAFAVRDDAYTDLSALTDVQSQASTALSITGDVATEMRGRVAELMERAGRHRVALAFGAEAYLDIEPIVPSSVIGSYHRSLVAATRASEAIKTANLLVERLDEALVALRGVVVAAERQQDEARNAHLTRAGGILAAVALVLTFVFGVYSSNAGPIGNKPLLSFKFGYIAFVVVACALVYVIVAVYRGDWRLRRQAPPIVPSVAARRRIDHGEPEPRRDRT